MINSIVFMLTSSALMLQKSSKQVRRRNFNDLWKLTKNILMQLSAFKSALSALLSLVKIIISNDNPKSTKDTVPTWRERLTDLER